MTLWRGLCSNALEECTHPRAASSDLMSFLIFQISMLSSACLFVSAASDMAAGVDCNSHAATSADPRAATTTTSVCKIPRKIRIVVHFRPA